MIMSPGDQVLVTAVIIVMVALAGFFLAAAAEYAKAARAWALRVHRLVEHQVSLSLDSAVIPEASPSCAHRRAVPALHAGDESTAALVCLDCRGWFPPYSRPGPVGSPPWEDAPPPPEGTEPLDMRDVL